METKLMEVRYADEEKGIRLTGYADTLILDGSALVGIRLGGYPEMVSGLAAAISAGGTLTILAGTEAACFTATKGWYAKTQSQAGAYAVAALLWSEQAVQRAERKQEKKEGDTEESENHEAPPRKHYLFCAPDDRMALYRELDRCSTIPMLPSFADWLLPELERRNILTPCMVYPLGTPVAAWRLTRSEDDANIAAVLNEGLRTGRLVIPGAQAGQTDVFAGITGVSSYLKAFGPALASRIRGQFRPLFDPAAEPLSDSVQTLNRFVRQTAGYPLYPAQLAAAEALKRRLHRGKFALLVAECGSGKSKTGSLAQQAYFLPANRKRLHIVLCPAHMTGKWVRELGETIPDSFAAAVHTPADFDALYERFARGGRTAFAVLSKEHARDGYMRRPAVHWNGRRQGFLCPDCGAVIQRNMLGCGEKQQINAEPSYFRTETRANRKCGACGAVLWTATHAAEQSEWARISHLGYVHRRFARQARDACKTRAAQEQVEELIRHPDCITHAHGACRRFPLSTYIKNKYRGRIDGLIADELHQYAADSGQGDAMGELFDAAKKCVGMTATLINGYASGIFYLLYRVCAPLMERDGQSYRRPAAFAGEYGVIETVYETSEGGYHSNRRTVRRKKREKQLPGVSPLVYSRFLLENAVFLSLADMGKELPEYEEIPVPVLLPPAQQKEYERLESAFRDILKDRSRDMRRIAQRLLSVYLNLLLAYPDQPYGHEPVVHPNTGNILLRPEDAGLPDEQSEKDKYVLELIQRKLAGGERVLLYVNWVRLDSRTRLLRLLTGNGVRAALLEEKVPPGKREQWVEDRLDEGLQVLITNPNLVETGLDLNAFTTLIFYDTAFKLFTFRQASRRSWRINQTAPRVEVYIMYYRGTMQERAVRLMANKLAAAGVIEGALTDEGLAAMSEAQDMTALLARELAEGIRHEHAVEDIAASFKKMAVLHGTERAVNPALAVVPEPPEAESAAEQASFWELAG